MHNVSQSPHAFKCPRGRALDIAVLQLPWTQLPTEAELRENYGVSRNTLRDAIRRLVTEGLVETRAGQGVFVVERITPFVTALSGHAGLGSGGDEGRVSVSEMVDFQRSADASPTWVEINPASDVAALLQVAPGLPTPARAYCLVLYGASDHAP
jgi:DNA-binding GntR family transcriptional regulator